MKKLLLVLTAVVFYLGAMAQNTPCETEVIMDMLGGYHVIECNFDPHPDQSCGSHSENVQFFITSSGTPGEYTCHGDVPCEQSSANTVTVYSIEMTSSGSGFFKTQYSYTIHVFCDFGYGCSHTFTLTGTYSASSLDLL